MGPEVIDFESLVGPVLITGENRDSEGASSNGAGKTTLFNAIAGDITPSEGRVLIKGIDCTALPSRLRPQLGVARTYQKTRLFTGLTVEDNLYLAQTGKIGRHLPLWRKYLRVKLKLL